MYWLRDLCPECGETLLASRFDTVFRMPDESERLCFEVVASLCGSCRQLYLAPELIGILDVAEGRCIFAIESDVVLRERTV
jgi:hypothetical protein